MAAPRWYDWIGLGLGLAACVWLMAFLVGWISVRGVSGRFMVTQTGGNFLFWIVPLAHEFARGAPRLETQREMHLRLWIYQHCLSVALPQDDCLAQGHDPVMREIAQRRMR